MVWSPPFSDRPVLAFQASSFLLEHDLFIFSDLPSPAEAGVAKAGNPFPLFGIKLQFMARTSRA
jgi:hypothetical protein